MRLRLETLVFSRPAHDLLRGHHVSKFFSLDGCHHWSRSPSVGPGAEAGLPASASDNEESGSEASGSVNQTVVPWTGALATPTWP
jgi:hypothetical protein